ncbi:hypothetical protein EIP86_005540 [Pleurotus ostreatoroseus]|nr:hypothetical protein EIP86_005540 [Pleurotus ostreatoroseus]
MVYILITSTTGHLPELFSRHGWGLQDNIDQEGKAVVKLIGMFNVPPTDKFRYVETQSLRIRPKGVAAYYFEGSAGL